MSGLWMETRLWQSGGRAVKGREMFTKDHAERLKENAGKPYRPSNGTEGSMFQDRFCSQCTKDNLGDEGKGGCEII